MLILDETPPKQQLLSMQSSATSLHRKWNTCILITYGTFTHNLFDALYKYVCVRVYFSLKC